VSVRATARAAVYQKADELDVRANQLAIMRSLEASQAAHWLREVAQLLRRTADNEGAKHLMDTFDEVKRSVSEFTRLALEMDRDDDAPDTERKNSDKENDHQEDRRDHNPRDPRQED
jgi:hypothetical protein